MPIKHKITNKNIGLSGVYIICNNIDNRVYIGSTCSFRKRIKEHKSKLRLDKHENIHLQRFYNKYGLNNISFSILEIINDEQEFLEKEQEFLNKTKNLFNICKHVKKPPVLNRSFNKKDILNIAKLYNSGKSCSQISEMLYGNRNFRSKINLIVKGEQYSEYKNIFNYKPYTQKGRKRNKFGKFTKNDLDFISKNKDSMSLRRLGDHITSYNHRTIGQYIKTL